MSNQPKASTMRGWNYRVVRYERDGPPGSQVQLEWFGLHEVYYDDDGSVRCWTPEPQVVGETKGEIVAALQMMLNDAALCGMVTRPILEAGDMPEA